MQPLERILLIDNDWITILLLAIVLLLVIVNSIQTGSFRLLLKLPYTNHYLLQDYKSLWSGFNILLFVISNLVLGLFIYVLIREFYVETLESNNYIYPRILLILALYWVFKYSVETIIFTLFESQKSYLSLVWIKSSYFNSANVSLLALLFFTIYSRSFSRVFLYISIAIYVFLLLIRYYHFINTHKRFILAYFFYFILYLCALEIAPILVAVKFGI